MLSRRRLLQSGLSTAAGVTFGKRLPAFGQAMASPAAVRSGVKLARYVDPLPIPRVIRATDNPTEILEVEMIQFQQKVHRDLPATTVWG
jgi:spore coat protein A, manganese oxidase